MILINILRCFLLIVYHITHIIKLNLKKLFLLTMFSLKIKQYLCILKAESWSAAGVLWHERKVRAA